MSRKKDDTSNVIVAILSILFVFTVVAFLFKFTNGLNEDLKTFYLEHNGKEIVATDSQMTFATEKEYRFDCKYISNPDNNTFNLEVIPNVTDKTDFNYTVDGESYKWSEIKDLTACFKLDKKANYFTISFPASFSIYSVLTSLYAENEVVISDTLSPSYYYYTLHVSNYNEKINYYIDFRVSNSASYVYDIDFVVDGEIVKSERVNQDTLITPPETPVKSGYTFDGWVDSSNSIVDFATYSSCENMTFTAKFSLITVNISFEFLHESTSSGDDTGSGGTEFYDVSSDYGVFSPSAATLSVENQNATITFTLNSGYTYSDYEVNSSDDITATPSALTYYPFGVTVSGQTVSLSLSSIPSESSNYTFSIIVTGSGSSSGGSDSGSMEF